jgi:hypothetical protein
MSTSDEITAAHDEVVRSRAQMADTVARLEARVTGQMDAVKAKLDVVQMIKDNPWTSIAVATGIGVAVSASGSDAKAAAATAAATRAAASAAAAKAREAAAAAKEAAVAAPGQAKSAASGAKSGLVGHLDEMAASLVTGLVERLKSDSR